MLITKTHFYVYTYVCMYHVYMCLFEIHLFDQLREHYSPENVLRYINVSIFMFSRG